MVYIWDASCFCAQLGCIFQTLNENRIEDLKRERDDAIAKQSLVAEQLNTKQIQVGRAYQHLNLLFVLTHFPGTGRENAENEESLSYSSTAASQ